MVGSPGWYGFVPAAGPGIIHRSLLSDEEGKIGLQKLAEPDYGSRSQDFEGRRMVRIDGGFLILNYQKYREKDYTAAVRSKRYREKKAAQALLTSGDGSHAVASQNHAVSTRSVTQAEAEEYLILDTVSQEYLGPVQALSSQKKEGTGTKSRNHRFSPPSQPELIDYFLSKDFSELEARKCFNWYDSQGWKVGKNPMKNWKAAARGWMLRAEEMK